MNAINRISRSGQGRGKTWLIFGLAIIAVAGISFGIAVYWQTHMVSPQGTQPITEQQSQQAQIPPTVSQDSLQESASQQDSQSSSQSQQESSLADSTQSPFEDLADVVVPKGDWVDSSYFDDAAFVGDSITYGLQVYNTMTNATIIAHTGINPQTILTKSVIIDGEETLTILEALEKDDPAKIYVMLGANGVAFLDEETMMGFYGDLIDGITQQHPDATVYVQSILPVTAEKSLEEGYSNDRIDQYNIALMNLAKEKGVYYLNVAEAFKDENGALPTEASPKDGMHFGATYYMKWFDYLKSHAVTE